MNIAVNEVPRCTEICMGNCTIAPDFLDRRSLRYNDDISIIR